MITNKDTHLIFISSLLNEDNEKKMIELLIEFKDWFIWSNKEMYGLSLDIVVHKLEIHLKITLVKHAPQWMQLNIK